MQGPPVVFTGLIQGVGDISGLERSADGVRVTIDTVLADELQEGDSIAVSGVCLTATTVRSGSFAADVMKETLARSSLASLERGGRVNLELPLRAGDRLGGHFVQGHVDGLGTVSEVLDDGFARRTRIEAPADLLRYVVAKGSITVDGVSLTVAELGQRWFTVSLIPETLQRTTLGAAVSGTKVNLEVDVLAKYVEKALGSRSPEQVGSAPEADSPGART